jgi:hypothetical protein
VLALRLESAKAAFKCGCIQFHIPRRAADAVDFPALRKRAHAMGFESTSVEYNSYRMRPGETLITASEPMAVLLVDSLREIGVRAGERGGQTELVIACATGVTAAFQAIDVKRDKSKNDSPSRS